MPLMSVMAAVFLMIIFTNNYRGIQYETLGLKPRLNPGKDTIRQFLLNIQNLMYTSNIWLY